jgi:hypothetical protein
MFIDEKVKLAQSTHHVMSSQMDCHVNDRTAYVLLDLNILY